MLILAYRAAETAISYSYRNIRKTIISFGISVI